MKIRFLISAFLIFFATFFAACFSSSRSTVNVSTTDNSNVSNENIEKAAGAMEAKPAGDEIRKVDFKNFTYEASCAGESPEKVSVKKGEFSRDKDDDKLYFNVMDISYGDVNGDGADDAIILTVCNTGGTGQFSEGFVYTLKDGKPALLTRIDGGDRADGGLRAAKVENGIVAVERNNNDNGGGACCPEFADTTKYKWNGKQLIQQGKPAKRELYPPQRVTFEKGNTSTVINVSVPAGELKRYVVGARAGQTLSVEANSKDFSASFVKGEADANDHERGFTANLNANGDYVFEVRNNSEKDAKTTVTVEIY